MDHDRENLPDLLHQALDEALAYLEGLDDRPAAVDPGEPTARDLPASGIGAREALVRFRERYGATLSASPGPRYLGFVTGGVTPAALAGDWLTSTFDQNAQANGDTCAPFVEREAVGFLRQLFDLPPAFTGSFVSGATTSNFVNLAIARQKLLADAGIDTAEEGLWGAPPLTVLGATLHSSVYKSLSMLGIGRKNVIRVPCLPEREAVDPAALKRELEALAGRPAIVVASAGTVNTGDFDDLVALAELRERHPFWLHVDGAFGLFAACSPRLAHLLRGLAAADSITVDGHKWLNVPYDSALQLSRHLGSQLAVFQNASSYLSRPEPVEHNYIHLVPENSRRFRALPAWMSLVAYGREGYRETVERCCDLARDLGEKVAGEKVAGESLFELLAPVRLNTVCFALRRRDGGLADGEQTRLFLTRLRDDGRAFLTHTLYREQPAIRCALTSWRTGPEDIEITHEALVATAKSLRDDLGG